MKHLSNGFLLMLQFFSVFPVNRELHMEKKDVTAMFGWLPVLGAIFGGLAAAVLYGLREQTDIHVFLLAFLLVALSVIVTGGLHLDGLADVGDAFFSYQERSKRLEIMGDPRIGAFGTMVLLFAVIGKILVIAEVALTVSLGVVILIPVLSRIGLLGLFSFSASAKPTGLASFFQHRANRRLTGILASAYGVMAILVLMVVGGWTVAFAFAAALVLAIILYRKWCQRNFGGVTGDLFGAFVEGVELLLWSMLLFLI
ncbi:MAG TPA: adenosylcobinamide-GDP ribazoletransferase [Planococcus sp. (in: firmicutes)]|nr:adenosylcobinamide-GDP ribazoletransferase [Planococcus sp. (in: firmicutes)]